MPNMFHLTGPIALESGAKTSILRSGMQPPQPQPPSSPPLPSEAEIHDAVGWLQDPSRQQTEGSAPSAAAQAIAACQATPGSDPPGDIQN